MVTGSSLLRPMQPSKAASPPVRVVLQDLVAANWSTSGSCIASSSILTLNVSSTLALPVMTVITTAQNMLRCLYICM